MGLKKLKLSVRETRFLLEEIQSPAAMFDVTDVETSRVWSEGDAPHKALVNYLSGLTEGKLKPHTATMGRLIRDETVDTEPGNFDTFEKVLTSIKSAVDQRLFTISKWVLNANDPPFKKGSVGSKTYDCLRVVVKEPLENGRIQPGVYVVPYAAKKSGNKFLFTNQILGAGAEHAVWAAMLQGSVDPNNLETDNRIGSFWRVSSPDDRKMFELYCNHMARNLATLPKWGGYGLKGVGGPPGKGSTTAAADLKAEGPDGLQYNISVKYGDTQRLGAVRIELNKPVEELKDKDVSPHNSSVLYKGLQVKYDSLLSKAAKPETDLTPFYAEMSVKGFERLLKRDVETMLGISKGETGAAKTLLVKFTEVEGDKIENLTGGDPSVSVLTGGNSGATVTVMPTPREDVNRKRMYLVKVTGGGKEATIEVELGAKSQNKAVTLHIRKGDEKTLESILVPPVSEASKRKPRRSEASTTAAVRGVTVPLGRGPDGRAAPGGEELLDRNAKVYGKSWGGAKRVKESLRDETLPEAKFLLRELFDIE